VKRAMIASRYRGRLKTFLIASGDGEGEKKEVIFRGLSVRKCPVADSGAGLNDAKDGVGTSNR